MQCPKLSEAKVMEKKPRIHVSELEFGYAMMGHKNQYPLEVVSCVNDVDERGQYYIPIVTQYVDYEQELSTGNRDGYANREQLMRCVGRCWDKAEKDIAERTRVIESAGSNN